MKKYVKLLGLSWQTGLTYRASVLLWRFRQFLSSLMALTIWAVVFTSTSEAFDYQQQQMLTYVFLASILHSIILATALNSLPMRVYSGELSQLLLKPINLFVYFGIEDVADKLKNLGFIILESVILYFLFSPTLVLPSLPILALFAGWVLLGTLLHFFITLIFGAIGFWSPDVWGPRFLFFMLLDFTAGKLFPLDILPEFIQKIVFLTPFPFFTFVQTQLFLGKVPDSQFLSTSLLLVFWVMGAGFLAFWTWRRGLRDYAAAGQ